MKSEQYWNFHNYNFIWGRTGGVSFIDIGEINTKTFNWEIVYIVDFFYVAQISL